jgi:hypothetical protein
MVLLEADGIKNDPDYFSQFTFFSNHPMMILNEHAFGPIRDTVVNEKECFEYKEEVRRKSNADTTQIVRYQKWFFIEKEIGDIVQITDITMREKDTLQVVDYFFTEYSYGVMAIPKIDPKYQMEYIMVGEEDAQEGFTYLPIKEGEKLSISNYINVDGQEISLFGEDEQSYDR